MRALARGPLEEVQLAETVQIFVYGTLMRGEPFHHLLGADAAFVRKARTAAGFTLLDLGAYPGMAAASGAADAVVGEVLDISAAMLPELDEYEDCPDLYTRQHIELDDGTRVVAYVLCPVQARAFPCMPGGDWRLRRLRA